MTRDLRTSEPRTMRRMFGNIERLSMGWNLPEQPAGSSSRSRRNRGAAGRNRGAAVEADARNQGAAAEADANEVQQLKRIKRSS